MIRVGWTLFLAGLLLLATSCAEPPDPRLSHIDAPSVIVLRDGREIRCPRVVEAGRGWECWGPEAPHNGQKAEYTPRSWYAPDRVAEVRRADSDNP